MQTLQLADFMEYNENAASWQIWSGLLAYLLRRHFMEKNATVTRMRCQKKPFFKEMRDKSA